MGRVLSLCLKEIVDALGGDLRGDPAFQVDGLAALDVAGPTQLASSVTRDTPANWHPHVQGV